MIGDARAWATGDGGDDEYTWFREGIVCPHQVLVLSGLASWDPACTEDGTRRIGRRRDIEPLTGNIGSMFVGARGHLR